MEALFSEREPARAAGRPPVLLWPLLLAAGLVFPPLLFIGAVFLLAVFVAGPPLALPAPAPVRQGRFFALSPRSPPRAV